MHEVYGENYVFDPCVKMTPRITFHTITHVDGLKLMRMCESDDHTMYY